MQTYNNNSQASLGPCPTPKKSTQNPHCRRITCINQYSPQPTKADRVTS